MSITRRTFLKQLGIISGCLIIGINSVDGKSYKVSNESDLFEFNEFVKLSNNGEVVIIASRSEMGQGVRTSLPSIVADELEADWEKVLVEQGLGDKKYESQNTDGSRSIRRFYTRMRRAGATVRMMLISAAANIWGVSEKHCYAKNHYVYNKKNNKKIFYGDLVEEAAKLLVPKKIILKNKKDFKYIGKSLKNIDLDDIVAGKAKFGIDIDLPGLLYASVARSPVVGGKVKKYNANKALALEGVIKVVEVKKILSPFSSVGGIAVVAKNTWIAEKGKQLLEIEWDEGNNKKYNTADFVKSMSKSVNEKGSIVKESGDIKKAFDRAENFVESEFYVPHLTHVTMEPLNAVAWVKGENCEIWAPTQAPQRTMDEASKIAGVSKDKIKVNVTLLGGGFGRKSKPDFVLEAVDISKQMKAPVKVTWTREDDIKHSYYHTVSKQYLKASLDKYGNVTGWLHRAAYPTIMSTFVPFLNKPADFEIGMGMTNNPYEIKNIQCEVAKTDSHVRIGWMRSVCNIFHSFAVNIFMDELAIKAKRDPLNYRLNLLTKDRKLKFDDSEFRLDTSRLRKVLKKVAENANWGKKRPENHGIGIAVHYSFYSYIAQVVEVDMTDERLTVKKVYSVVDCGTVVNEDTVKAQVEGSVIFGLSLALYGDITAKDGKIQQNNFYDYELLRIDMSPEIETEIIKSDLPPTGIGEPGVPPLAPALVNAIFDATGKRYYNLPLKYEGII